MRQEGGQGLIMLQNRFARGRSERRTGGHYEWRGSAEPNPGSCLIETEFGCGRCNGCTNLTVKVSPCGRDLRRAQVAVPNHMAPGHTTLSGLSPSAKILGCAPPSGPDVDEAKARRDWAATPTCCLPVHNSTIPRCGKCAPLLPAFSRSRRLAAAYCRRTR